MDSVGKTIERVGRWSRNRHPFGARRGRRHVIAGRAGHVGKDRGHGPTLANVPCDRQPATQYGTPGFPSNVTGQGQPLLGHTGVWGQNCLVTATLRVEIFPADIDETIAFYTRLGFQVIGRSDGSPRYASMRLGDVRIGASEAERVNPAQRAVPSGTEIVIEVDDVQAFRDRAAADGRTLEEDLRERPWGLIDFRMTDPDGYYLRFTSHR